MRRNEIALVFATALLIGAPVAADSGKANFEKVCAGCHGKDGHADTTKGKKLKAADYRQVKELSGPDAIAFIEKTVRENKKHKAVSKKLSDEDLAAIAQYVHTMVAGQK